MAKSVEERSYMQCLDQVCKDMGLRHFHEAQKLALSHPVLLGEKVAKAVPSCNTIGLQQMYLHACQDVYFEI